jgi:hypothetical protein
MSASSSSSAKIAEALKEIIRIDLTRSDAESEARYDLALGVGITDDALCQARLMGEPDARFKPMVFSERQCSRRPAEGDDLCKSCRKNLENFAVKEGAAGQRWHNRVTEPITGHSHTLTSEWAEAVKPKWYGP